MAQKDKVKELVGRGLGSYHTKALQQIDRIEKKNKEQSHKISILTNELDNDYLTKTEEGSVISLDYSKEGMIYLDELQGNTLVNYCVDGSKELTLNGDIDVEGTNVTLTEGVDNGKVDVVCEGNTLVNLVKEKIDIILSETLSHSNRRYLTHSTPNGEPFTLIANINYSGDSTQFFVRGYNTNQEYYEFGASDFITNYNGIIKILCEKNLDIGCDSILIGVRNSKIGTIIKDVMVLEGDWTNKEVPPYFEGMKSVGECEDNKIEILSMNNIINLNNYFNGHISSSGNFVNADTKNKTYIVPCKPNTEYKVGKQGGNRYRIASCNTTDVNNGTEVVKHYELETNDNWIEKTFVTSSDAKCILLYFGTEHKENIEVYEPRRLNKKEISLNEPLRGLPNGVKDRFVKQGGKWYVERRLYGLTLNGGENEKWNMGFTNFGTPIFTWNDTGINICRTESYHSVLSDRFIYAKHYSQTAENHKCIYVYNYQGLDDSIRIQYPSNSVEEFRNYLSNNPIKVIIQLETPTYEEITDVELITYLDTTHISNNSTIPCNMKIQNSGYNAIIKPSTQYTVAFDTNTSGTVGINLGGSKVTTTNNVATITTPRTLTDDSLMLYGKGIKASNVRLLEGDKTNWIPSFFEGMKSSFEDKLQEDGTYKMEILSKNKNLFSGTWEKIPNSKQHTSSYIKVNPNSKYIFSVSDNYNTNSAERRFTVQFYNEDKKYISYIVTGYLPNNVKIDTPYNCEYIKIFTRANNDFTGEHTNIEDCNVQLEKGIEVTSYISPKSNKIQFSSIEPLRGIGNVKDKFVFKDGKLMIERNIKNIVFDGSQSGYYYARWYTNDSLVRVGILTNTSTVPKNKYNVAPISPQYLGYKWYTTINHESIHIGGSNDIHFVLDSNRFKTKDLNGAKEFLSKNPIDVCYVLDEPTYEEIPFELQKIILEGYEDGTLFFDTNIPPTSTVTYAGETPIVKATRLNKTEVLNNTTDINDNIVPYLMDMDYRVVCLQLEGGIENISMARLFGGTYEMLQRDILSNRYSKEEYKHRLDAYLSANKITEDEYTKLGDMLNG